MHAGDTAPIKEPASILPVMISVDRVLSEAPNEATNEHVPSPEAGTNDETALNGSAANTKQTGSFSF